MPSCYHGFITNVLDVYLAENPKKVLDIGIGFGKWGSLFREYGDIFRGRFYQKDWQVQIDGIEVFESYKTPIYDFIYNNVRYGDIKMLYPELGGYDFVYAGDVIEHLYKFEALEVLDFFKNNTKTFVVSIPLTNVWEQGEVFGNAYEEHKSVWAESDFEGYEKIIKLNPKGKPIGLFIHRRS